MTTSLYPRSNVGKDTVPPLVLINSGAAFVVVALTAAAMGRLPYYRASGLMAIALLLVGVGNALLGSTLGAAIAAAGAAWTAWRWWNGGGGDGTRRRLRSLMRWFRGVRRTAPAGAP